MLIYFNVAKANICIDKIPGRKHYNRTIIDVPSMFDKYFFIPFSLPPKIFMTLYYFL